VHKRDGAAGLRWRIVASTARRKIASQPGDHRKTCRLGAVHLAQQFRRGHLTAVSMPDVDQEAACHVATAHSVHSPDVQSGDTSPLIVGSP
jgi:hypothetical protein